MALEKAYLISVKLDGSNYAVWKFHFQSFFFLKGKVYGDIWMVQRFKPDETDVKKTEQWKIVDAKIISWILGSICKYRNSSARFQNSCGNVEEFEESLLAI